MLEKVQAPQNAQLLRLGPADLRSICSEFHRADLVPFERLSGKNYPIAGVWFPESGFISVTVRDGRGIETEVAMVGREGACGQFDAFAEHGANTHLIAQHRGVAHFVAASRLKAITQEVPALNNILASARSALLQQFASTAHANARGRVAQRLARWLLMAHDRIDCDVIFVTHDILAKMLGVRRVGVTNALHILEGERLIRAFRGRIRLVDREGLIKMTEGLYVQTEPAVFQPVAEVEK